MSVVIKEKPIELIKVKSLKINTLVPNFKFKNKLGEEERLDSGYIILQ